MDNGAPSSDQQVDRRVAPPSRTVGSAGGIPATSDRRKSPPRPRKPAGATATADSAVDLVVDRAVTNGIESAVAVADRIDPLLAASSAVLDHSPEVVAPKPVRRRPPARKPLPVEETVDTSVEPTTTQIPIVEDFFAEAITEPASKPASKKRVEARVPYVLPKIIPGEPDPEPESDSDAEAGSESDTESAGEQESIFAKVAARIPYKPQFRGVTKRLKRSLQPVVLPRHRPRVRRVMRVLRHIDTWSVFKIALLFNIFLYAVCLTAGAMLWRVALNTGTIENIERFFESFGWQTFRLKGGEIYHNAWIIGLFGVVGLTGLAVLAATMFNLITDLVGGVRLTVLEEEVVAREQRVVTWPRLLRPPTPPRNSEAKPPID